MLVTRISTALRKRTAKMPNSFMHYNYIFVHIPKTAGIGVSLSLNGVWHGHCMLREYEKMVARDKFLSMFKFTFVRDPIDRFVSTANFIAQGGRSGIGNEDCRNLNTKYRVSEVGISAFVQQLEVDNLPFHFIPQHRWLERYDGRLGVDFIGRVEEIEQDYAFIADRLGLSNRQLVHRNRSGVAGLGRGKKFSREDLDEGSIKKLKLMYDRDYRLFDY